MDRLTPDNRIAKQNIAILIVIQMSIGAMIPIHFTLGGPVGSILARYGAIATLPVTATIIGGMVSAPLVSRASIGMGRPRAFAGATLIAFIGLVLAGLAIQNESFWLYVTGSFCLGFYMSAQGMFRFAATDMATPEFRARAVSFALVGGLFSALVSRYIVKNHSTLNAAQPYFIMAVITFALIGAYYLLKLPIPKKGEPKVRPPVGPILRDKKVLASMVISISAYSIMNLMMTSTPLAVEGCGFTRGDSASIVSAHVIAMYFPSFFTGYLISWFGLRAVVFTGIGILIASSFVGLMGVDIANFYVALILLGIGWNFAFIGGTTMLTSAISDPDASKALQGLNDTILWSFVAFASLTSGVLMNYFGDGGEAGWRLVCIAMLPVLIVALLIGVWLLQQDMREKEQMTTRELHNL